MLPLPKVMLAVVLLLIVSLPGGTSAHEHKKPKGKVSFENVWARATFALAKTGAVYLELNNNSEHQIKLLSVSVDASIASEAQVHETFMQEDNVDGMDNGIGGGMMQMREAEGGVIIPSGSRMIFEPGGKHIMLLGLEKPLTQGDQFILSFTFENNKVVRVPVLVEDAR